MKVKVELNNLTKSPLKAENLKKVVAKTLKKTRLVFLEKRSISVSLALVGAKEIRKINKTYRKKNSATDVLSFAEHKNIAEIKKQRGELFLGELILCYDDIKQYVKKEGLNVKTETEKAVAHGVLHLLGYRHGKKMFDLQEK
ncbi:MAG: rRNA maturation RNase YbeY [Candidatus Moranbacteria bacterium CG10_big_fil_rev_8_21_14_0_10_35_21]|nr:MAG: rRNA maturation RNase YbeY [Candidatus Moranbacteria bacterium CG10_big_fil_rev_8_21_14_0_10_35_21]